MDNRKILDQLNAESRTPQPGRRVFLSLIITAAAAFWWLKGAFTDHENREYVKISNTNGTFEIQYMDQKFKLQLTPAPPDNGPLALIYSARDIFTPDVQMDSLLAQRAADLFNLLYSNPVSIKELGAGKKVAMPSILENLANGEDITIPFRFAPAPNLINDRWYLAPTYPR